MFVVWFVVVVVGFGVVGVVGLVFVWLVVGWVVLLCVFVFWVCFLLWVGFGVVSGFGVFVGVLWCV